MSDQITVTGFVGTTPKHLVTASGFPITSFRLGSTSRRLNRETGKWEDGDTNWYSVNTYRRLATHAAASIDVGQRVIITGRLRVRNWEKDDKHGTNVEIDADGVGHDLLFGTSTFTRAMNGTSREEDTFSEIEAAERESAAAGMEGFPPEPDAAGSTVEELAVPF